MVYLAIGSLAGMYMGITKDLALASVHAHIALLGWLASAISGVVYMALPTCGLHVLARLHVWGHNIGLPPMVISLSLCAYGVKAAETIVGISSSLLVASLLIFAANVGRNAHRTEKSGAVLVRESAPSDEVL